MSGEHQSLILQRALVAGAVGLLPVPYLDEYLAGEVRAALIRKLAESRGVDIDELAILTLVRPQPSSVVRALGLGAFALAGARRAWRKIAATLFFVRRVDDALQAFQIGTLFDHYCESYDVGMRLDADHAALLRAAMDQAVHSAHVTTLEHAFRKALDSAIALSLAVPRSAVGLWTRLSGGQAPAHPLPAFEAPDEAPEPSSALPRALRLVQRAVAAPASGYVHGLRAAFDRVWRSRRPGT